MSDDSFIREVDEELRSERVQDFWKRYGNYIIGLAVAIVVVTAGYKFYEAYSRQQAASAGDAFMNAVQLADTGKRDEAIAKLRELEASGSPSYAALARLRIGAELAAKGDSAGAIKDYDALAGDSSADQNLRSMARIRAGMLLVDTGTVTEVEARVGSLTGPGGPYRASAKEALALAYYKAGDLTKASGLLNELVADAATPRALSQRSQLLLDFIASQGGPGLKKAEK